MITELDMINEQIDNLQKTKNMLEVAIIEDIKTNGPQVVNDNLCDVELGFTMRPMPPPSGEAFTIKQMEAQISKCLDVVKDEIVPFPSN